MKSTNFDIKGRIPVISYLEDDHYIVYTPALEITTQAKSLEDSKKRFDEAVSLFFEHIVEEGTLEEVLTDLGWKKQGKDWEAPTVIENTLQNVSFSNR